MYDYLIIGAWIIGLNIAKFKRKISKCSNFSYGKEKEVAMHSGRNSGVLHAGFYYTANSLKAKFTKEGNAALKEFCNQRNLKINPCQKVVVALNDKEVEGLEELKKRMPMGLSFIVDEKGLKELDSKY